MSILLLFFFIIIIFVNGINIFMILYLCILAFNTIFLLLIFNSIFLLLIFNSTYLRLTFRPLFDDLIISVGIRDHVEIFE